MSELEKKIKYHLDLILGIKKDWGKLAEGLSEIAYRYFDVMTLKILELQKENGELKKQVDYYANNNGDGRLSIGRRR